MAKEKWISIKDKMPSVNDKFKESDHILCYAPLGPPFVGWYNSNLNQWFVSHHLAESVPLSNDSIPTHWMSLPKDP